MEKRSGGLTKGIHGDFSGTARGRGWGVGVERRGESVGWRGGPPNGRVGTIVEPPCGVARAVCPSTFS
jgi:hypothetical protein